MQSLSCVGVQGSKESHLQQHPVVFVPRLGRQRFPWRGEDILHWRRVNNFQLRGPKGWCSSVSFSLFIFPGAQTTPIGSYWLWCTCWVSRVCKAKNGGNVIQRLQDVSMGSAAKHCIRPQSYDSSTVAMVSLLFKQTHRERTMKGFP